MSNVLDYVTQTQWLLDESTLSSLIGVLHRHLEGEKLAPAAVAEIVAVRRAKRANRDAMVALRPVDDEEEGDGSPQPYTIGSVRVIPIEGVLCRYAGMINGTSQPRGTTTAAVSEALGAAIADPQIGSILLEFDCPGGTMPGTAELADQVARANASKPVVAHVHDLCASGGYWIASQAGSIYAGPTGIAGSIAAYTVIADTSRRTEERGVKLHLVRTGPAKGIGEPGLPVSEDDLKVIQERLNAGHREFVKAVAAGRGMRAEAVPADGRVYMGEDALRLGLIDGIMHFDALIEKMEMEHGQAAGGGGSPSRALRHGAQRTTYLAEVERIQSAQGVTRAEAITIVNQERPDLREIYCGRSPAMSAPSRAASPSAGSSGGGYLAAVDQVMKRDGVSRAEAIRVVNKEQPELRRAYARG